MNLRISTNIIRRAGVFSAAAIVAVAPFGIAPPGASASTCAAWTGVQPPNPDPSFNELNGVAVLSSCNAWAVGSYHAGMGTGGAQTLILHWNGAVWKQVASPNPGSAENILTGVAAISATNIWAVGFSWTTGPERTLILHWNGMVWKQVASPSPSSGGSFLTGVAATSASNAWAVGGEGFNGPPFILHWNGTAWRRVVIPIHFTGNILNGVAATSSRNAWAVGVLDVEGPERTLILHWNGIAWRRVGYPNPYHEGNFTQVLQGVAATSARNAWAVGSYDSGTVRQTLALHCC
jgi:hypothetical protein